VPSKTRQEFLTWLKQLEYEIYGLPREDLVIYLRVPPSEAHRLVGEKAARGYTKRRRDLQEANLAHLKAASEVYDELARQPNWVSIECSDPAGERIRRIDDKALRKVRRTRRPERVEPVCLRNPEAIHQEILALFESRALPALKVKG
jgi:dTMP kinase